MKSVEYDPNSDPYLERFDLTQEEENDLERQRLIKELMDEREDEDRAYELAYKIVGLK